MAGPNLVSFQGTANTQNPNTSEITVSAANPLPVTITEGNLSLGNVTLAAGNATIGQLTGNQSVNVAQINGTAPAVDAGAYSGAVALSPAAGLGPGSVFYAVNTAGAAADTSGVRTLRVSPSGLYTSGGATGVTTGQFAPIAVDPAGRLLLGGDTYVNLAASATTTVKGTPGIVKAVTVNSKGTVASTVTIKDGATTVAIIDSLNLSGTFNLNAVTTANITAVITGTVAPNVTITYQ